MDKREIKFRAWNKKSRRMFDPQELTPLALNTDCKELAGVFIPFHEDVELMQFTGLKDKNGKEAYHKDIVEVIVGRKNTYWVIEWSDDQASFILRSLLYGDLPVFKINEMLIIGNTCENPELINGR
jgi:uncharacterized phage protein (TIGR01671 family)